MRRSHLGNIRKRRPYHRGPGKRRYGRRRFQRDIEIGRDLMEMVEQNHQHRLETREIGEAYAFLPVMNAIGHQLPEVAN